MNTQLKPTEQITLQAFLLALSELDSPLPEDMQHEIHQMGNSLAQKDYRVINQIPELVKEYEPLNELYRKARYNLQQDYQIQERDKLVVYNSEETVFNNYNLGEIALDDIAASLFQADDFKLRAEQILKPFKNTSDSFINLWKNTLTLAKIRTNLQAVSILKAIETVPFTTEDLTYKFDVPKENTINLVQKLWNEGKIDTLGGGLARRIIPQLRKKRKPNLKDPLTLTSWGFFYLHPIISINKY